jgi:TolA-binding protein
LADCYYFLGKGGKQKQLLLAIDQYRNILRCYPDTDTGKKNEIVHYRLAKSYENLKFYYEALTAYEGFIPRYPDSHYLPEVMFKMGEMLHKAGKYKEAIEKFWAYLVKFPDGSYAKATAFTIGDCYYRTKQEVMAEVTYSEARKKWPDLGDISGDILINLGYHYFQRQKFTDAIGVFSLYLSLYPKDDPSRGVLYILARSFREMDQPITALKIFSMVMERYPQSEEAVNSALMMANIGVTRPGIKAPLYLKGIDHYLDPIHTYNGMLIKYPRGELVERLLLQKGYALWKYGRYRESVDTYLSFLKQFPDSKYHSEGEKNLKFVTGIVIDEYHKKGDHVAVVDLYFKVWGNGSILGDDFPILLKIGDSLKKIGLYDDAFTVFSSLKQRCKDSPQNNNGIILTMAEIDSLSDRDKDAQEKLIFLLSGLSPENNPPVIAYAKKILADVYYKRGLFEEAIPLYAYVLRSGMAGADVYQNYATALKEKNMYALAITNYREAIKDYTQNRERYPAGIITRAYFGLADCYFKDKKYQEGILMKEGNERDFWGKVIDYWVEDNKWSENNAGYLK